MARMTRFLEDSICSLKGVANVALTISENRSEAKVNKCFFFSYSPSQVFVNGYYVLVYS